MLEKELKVAMQAGGTEISPEQLQPTWLRGQPSGRRHHLEHPALILLPQLLCDCNLMKDLKNPAEPSELTPPWEIIIN